MSSKNRDFIFEPPKRGHPIYESYSFCNKFKVTGDTGVIIDGVEYSANSSITDYVKCIYDFEGQADNELSFRIV